MIVGRMRRSIVDSDLGGDCQAWVAVKRFAVDGGLSSSRPVVSNEFGAVKRLLSHLCIGT